MPICISEPVVFSVAHVTVSIPCPMTLQFSIPARASAPIAVSAEVSTTLGIAHPFTHFLSRGYLHPHRHHRTRKAQCLHGPRSHTPSPCPPDHRSLARMHCHTPSPNHSHYPIQRHRPSLHPFPFPTPAPLARPFPNSSLPHATPPPTPRPGGLGILFVIVVRGPHAVPLPAPIPACPP